MKVNAPSKPTASQTASVSAKSASVSPGKPTMMSVVSAMSGLCSRISATRSVNRSREYVRRMALRIREEPDCSGRCMCGQTDSSSACARTTSSVMSCGCGEV